MGEAVGEAEAEGEAGGGAKGQAVARVGKANRVRCLDVTLGGWMRLNVSTYFVRLSLQAHFFDRFCNFLCRFVFVSVSNAKGVIVVV